jgi:hypothetical protein
MCVLGTEMEELTMPVHFADSARLDVEMCRSNGLGDGEVQRVSDADLTTGGVDRLLSKHLVRKLHFALLVALASTGDLLFDRVRQRALEDILLLLGNGLEDLWRNTKVLS